MVLEAINGVLRRNKLKWFGHMERKENEDLVSTVHHEELSNEENMVRQIKV